MTLHSRKFTGFVIPTLLPQMMTQIQSGVTHTRPGFATMRGEKHETEGPGRGGWAGLGDVDHIGAGSSVVWPTLSLNLLAATSPFLVSEAAAMYVFIPPRHSAKTVSSHTEKKKKKVREAVCRR